MALEIRHVVTDARFTHSHLTTFTTASSHRPVATCKFKSSAAKHSGPPIRSYLLNRQAGYLLAVVVLSLRQPASLANSFSPVPPIIGRLFIALRTWLNKEKPRPTISIQYERLQTRITYPRLKQTKKPDWAYFVQSRRCQYGLHPNDKEHCQA